MLYPSEYRPIDTSKVKPILGSTGNLGEPPTPTTEPYPVPYSTGRKY